MHRTVDSPSLRSPRTVHRIAAGALALTTLPLLTSAATSAWPTAFDEPLGIPWYAEVTYAEEQSDPAWLRDDLAIEGLASTVSAWSQSLDSLPPSAEDIGELRLILQGTYDMVSVEDGEFYYTWALIEGQLRRVCHPKIQISILDGSLQDEALVLFPAPISL